MIASGNSTAKKPIQYGSYGRQGAARPVTVRDEGTYHTKNYGRPMVGQTFYRHDEPPKPEHRDAIFALATEIEPWIQKIPDDLVGTIEKPQRRALFIPVTGWDPLEPMRWDKDKKEYLFN